MAESMIVKPATESVMESAVRATVQVWTAGESAIVGAYRSARKAGAHATGEMTASRVDVAEATSGEAARMTSTEAGVATETTAVTTALSPDGNREEESERRDEQQATHMKLL